MDKETLSVVNIPSEQVYSKRDGVPFVANKADVAPFSLGIVDKSAPIRIKDSGSLRFKTLRSEITFEKISRIHGRSMTESASSKSVIWGGPLKGDIYGARSVKGTAMNEGLSIKSNSASDYGVHTMGLMDDSSIDRCIRVSEVLRKHGLPTEKPVEVLKLNKLLVRDGNNGVWEKLPVSEWKKLQENGSKRVDEDFAKKVSLYLSETNYLAMERHVQVDERLRDLDTVFGGYEGLADFMSPIFKWLNTAVKYRNGGLIAGTPKPEEFDTSIDSMRKYFYEFLPSQIGTYLGKMHKLGIAHGFPHSQNWSMVGTLYDLDSPSGLRIYRSDGKPSNSEYVEDLSVTIGDTGRSIGRLINDVLGGKWSENTNQKVRAQVVRSYIKTCYGHLNPVTKAAFKYFYVNNGDVWDLGSMSSVWDLV